MPFPAVQRWSRRQSSALGGGATGTSVDGELGDEARGHFWRILLEAETKGLGLIREGEQGPG